jgi:hypothetical protein
VVTQSQMMRKFKRAVFFGGTPETHLVNTEVAPDLIDALQDRWQDLALSHVLEQREAIQEILSYLNAGIVRWWRCNKCQKKQRYPARKPGGRWPGAGLQKGKINRVEICFVSRLPSSYSEERAITELVRYFDLQRFFTDDVHISTSYGSVDGVAECLNTGNCSQELLAFVVARAAVLGMDRKAIGRIVPRPFTFA